MKEIILYFTEINNVTTKSVVLLPNNIKFIFDEVKFMLRENPQFLFCRFSFMGSNYQINNKNYLL